MGRPFVRCRCGHYVLAKEVLRTDLYERPSGRNYVYVKFRCQRCKRQGQAFVAESRWDWSIFEPVCNEMSDSERDQFADRSPVTIGEILDFHRHLQDLDSLDIIAPGNGSGNGTGSVDRALGGERAAADHATNARQKDAKAEAPPVGEPVRVRGEEPARPANSKNPNKNSGDGSPPTEDFPPAPPT